MFDIYSANEWSTKKRKDFLCDQLKNWPSLFNFLNQKNFLLYAITKYLSDYEL